VQEQDNMASLLENQEIKEFKEREVVKGIVVQVSHNEAYVDIGYKQEIAIPKNELAYPAPESAEDVVKVNDEIEVLVVSVGNENGPILSKVKADKLVAFREFEALVENKEIVEAHIVSVTKGGLVAAVRGVRGFIPASQVALNYVKDLNEYVDQDLEVLPIECDPKKNKLVLSRRELLQKERDEKKDATLKLLADGQEIFHGTVKRLVNYGAFIDIGGVDGLAYISELSWGRVKNPADVLQVNQEVDVKVLEYNQETGRISLSVKATMADPWFEKADRYQEGQVIEGKIINLKDFGAFMEIEPGFDGLIPMGELAEKRIEDAHEVVNNGDVVTVKILNIDKAKKRISLSMKRAQKEAKSAE